MSEEILYEIIDNFPNKTTKKVLAYQLLTDSKNNIIDNKNRYQKLGLYNNERIINKIDYLYRCSNLFDFGIRL